MKKELVVLEVARILKNPNIWVIFLLLVMEALYLGILRDYSLIQLSTLCYLGLGYSLAFFNVNKHLDITEYLLSKPFTRMDMLYSKLVAIFLLIVVVLLSATVAHNLAEPKMREFGVDGYENVKWIEENTQLEKKYFDLDDQEKQQILRSQIDTLLEQGKVKEAEKMALYYSEYFQLDVDFRKTMIFDFLVLIVSALSATFWVGFESKNTIVATIRAQLLESTYWISILPMLLLLLFYSLEFFPSPKRTNFLMLSFFLTYFEFVVAVAAAWVMTLIFLLRKKYSQLSY